MALSHKKLMAKRAKKAAARKGKTYNPRKKYFTVLDGEVTETHLDTGQSVSASVFDNNTVFTDSIKIS